MNLKDGSHSTEELLVLVIERLDNIYVWLRNKRITDHEDFDYLNTADLCKLLGVSKRTVGNLKAKGIIGSTRLLGTDYFRQSEVKQELERRFNKKQIE